MSTHVTTLPIIICLVFIDFISANALIAVQFEAHPKKRLQRERELKRERDINHIQILLLLEEAVLGRKELKADLMKGCCAVMQPDGMGGEDPTGSSLWLALHPPCGISSG